MIQGIHPLESSWPLWWQILNKPLGIHIGDKLGQVSREPDAWGERDIPHPPKKFPAKIIRVGGSPSGAVFSTPE